MFNQKKRFIPSFLKVNASKRSVDKFPEDMWQEHDELCPVCRGKLKKDPIGGFFLRCFNCGWRGW